MLARVPSDGSQLDVFPSLLFSFFVLPFFRCICDIDAALHCGGVKRPMRMRATPTRQWRREGTITCLRDVHRGRTPFKELISPWHVSSTCSLASLVFAALPLADTHSILSI